MSDPFLGLRTCTDNRSLPTRIPHKAGTVKFSVARTQDQNDLKNGGVLSGGRDKIGIFSRTRTSLTIF